MSSLTKVLAGVAASVSLALGGWTYAQGEKVAALEAQVQAQGAALTIMAANTQADVREIRADIRSIRESLVDAARTK